MSNTINMDPVEAALDSLKSLKPKGMPNPEFRVSGGPVRRHGSPIFLPGTAYSLERQLYL